MRFLVQNPQTHFSNSYHKDIRNNPPSLQQTEIYLNGMKFLDIQLLQTLYLNDYFITVILST